MCRWIAYAGAPIYMDQLITQPKHSLLRQSFDTRMNFHTDGSLWSLNADGFGVGWYNRHEEPGLFKDTRPAWSDENLQEICTQVRASMFMAHIRAKSTGAVQRSNSHPFKYKKFLFQHNGYIANFEIIRQAIQSEVHPDLFPSLKGTTDSETFFYLALSYGMADDPAAGFAKAIDKVVRVCIDNHITPILNFSCALMDGKTLYTFLHAFGDATKTQFYSGGDHCPEDLGAEMIKLPKKSIVVVSEPLNELSAEWQAVLPNSFVTVRAGEVAIENFMR